MVRRHLNRPHRAVFFAPITAIFSGALPFPGWCRERRDPTLAIRVLIRVMLMFRFSLFLSYYSAAGAYPEGVARNARAGAFLVSTLRGGQLGPVYPNGRYRRFSTGKGLSPPPACWWTPSVIGCWCATKTWGSLSSAPGTRNRVAQVLEFNLDTGELQQTYDLSSLSRGPTLANDLALDAQGNIYVTDSFQPQIYKIDRATRGIDSDALSAFDAGRRSRRCAGHAALSQRHRVSPGWLSDCGGLHPRAVVEGDVG